MTASNNANTIITQTSAGKSVKTIDAGKAVLKAKAGEHYSVVDQNNGQHPAKVIATKVGNHLVLDYANGVQVTIEDYFSVCENNECTVTVAGEDGAAYQIAAEAEGVAVDGGSLIYAHGDKNTLMAMAKGNAALSNALTAAFGDLAVASEAGLPEAGAGSSFWTYAAGGLAILGTAAAANSGISELTIVNDAGSISAITGTATQGETLMAGTITDANGTSGGSAVAPTYVWKADGVDIPSATASTYTLTQAEVGKAITVEVSYTDAQGTPETVISAPTAAVVNVDDAGNINDAGSISAITGTATQGETLTAGTITDADGTTGGSSVTPTYVWKADNVVITGATSNTYTLTQAEVGKVITVEVSYTDALGTTETVISAATAAVVNVDDAGSISAITGTVIQGGTLTAGTITDADGTSGGSAVAPTYVWKADGEAITGATSNTYTLTQAEVGKAITVEVSYTDAQGMPETVTSAATAAVVNVNDAGSISAITGTLTQSETLTAGTISDADGTTGGSAVAPTYVWKADNVVISGATAATYTLTQAEVGKTITVEVSYTDAQGTSETVISAPTEAVANINDPSSISAITGTLIQGETLTAGTITDADGTTGGSAVAPTYVWRADDVVITGATSNTYTLTQAEVGKVITVEVSYTDAQGTPETITSAPTTAVVNINDLGRIGAITGTLTLGGTLTAGTITDDDGTTDITPIYYVWKADGVVIPSATEATYTLTQAEVGKMITVEVSYTDAQGTPETATSAATAAVGNGSISAITGTLIQGETLTAGTITDADGTTGGSAVPPTYVWKADNVVITGATSNTYTLTQAEVGKVITVEASYTDAQGTPETITSAPTAAVANINDPGSISAITGTATQGQTLTAGTITDADGTSGGSSVAPAYVWRADGVNILGGLTASNTYTLTQAEVGKAITVEAIYIDAYGTSERVISAPTAVVTDVNEAGSISTITGTATQGQTLTAGTITDADGTSGGSAVPPTYEWRADGVAIAGATSNTYTLTQAEVGKVITVEVSYTDAQGTPETVTSAATAAVVNVDDAGSISAIEGTATQGQTLMAGTITDADGGVTGITYQWRADGSDIDGATANAYTLTQAEVGKIITVVAAYTDNEGSDKTAASAATEAVANINDPSSISAITGTLIQGETLTAGTITDADGTTGGSAVAPTYVWRADDVVITGATSNTYTLTQAEVGKVITVEVSYTDAQGTPETITSAPTTAVVNINDLGRIGAITGTLTLGGTLTAGTITDDDGTTDITPIYYVWKADGVVIPGATEATYTLTQAEVGKMITVEVSYTDAQGTPETATSAATAAVGNGSISAITGTATQGETLTAGTITDADGTTGGSAVPPTYVWKADNVVITGATSNTYTLTQAEVGKVITVEASYTDAQGTPETITSAPTAAVANINDPGSISAITGTATQGQTLTAGTITDADGTSGGSAVPPTYVWRADGVNILGGLTASNTYTLTQAEVGKAITVEAIYIDAYGTSERVISAPTAVVTDVNEAGSISTITGTATQGQTLTAGTITDADGTSGGSAVPPTYEWRADGVAIAGATSNTYTLTQAEVGKVITVEVSYTDAQGTPETVTSAATAAVVNVDDAGSISAIEGTATQGQTLMAGTITDADGGVTGITYQWRADGSDIDGATANAYTLTQAEVGKIITVVAAYTDNEGSDKTAASAATEAVANINDPSSISAITGTLIQGETLTAGTITDADGTTGGSAVAPTYVWRADDVVITGATSNTYTLTQAEVGKVITVEVSYTDAQGTPETITSAPTTAVVNINDLGRIGAITGTLTLGGTLTAGTITDDDGTTDITPIYYVWKADGVVIPGATEATYTLTQAEVGKMITVEVSYTDAQGTPETATSAATAAVGNGSISAITGTATQGETLTAGTITDADGTTGGSAVPPTYVWKADNVVITGATSNTYTLTQAEVGKVITVEASYTDAQGTPETITSAPTAAVANINDPGSISAIIGTATQGSTLTAGTITDADGTTGGSAVAPYYVWKADGLVIRFSGTGNTHTLTQAEVGKAITVEARYTDAQGTRETVTSAATAVVTHINQAASISAITGTVIQGETLTAGTITDADGTTGGRSFAPRYLWKADGVAIGDFTTSNTYTLTQAEVGKVITVDARYIDALGTTERVTSVATAAVGNINDPGSISAITGTLIQGETLTAGTITDADGTTDITPTYVWKADDVVISGAITSTYTLTQAEVGKVITVEVSYTDALGTSETITSAATAAVGALAFNNKVAAVYVAENLATSAVVYDAQAGVYQGLDANDNDITYTISGSDSGAFTIDAATGELSFVAVPDFETPADADTDNSYELSITATHTPSGQSVDQTVTINVLNQHGPGAQQNVHGTQLTAYTRTTADSTPVLEGTGPAGATISVGFAGAGYYVVADSFGSWRIDTETATPTSGSLTIDIANGAAGTWNAITLSATVEGVEVETLSSVSGITIADVSTTDASAFHLQTYADGTTSADGAANDIDYRSYNGNLPSTQNAILIGKSELEYISNADLIGLGEAGIGALTWAQVASLSPEQLSALHDENLLDNFNFGSGDKPSMILNAITGTDIISEQEMADGFTVKIDGSGFADATVKLLLDNDRGSWDAPDDEATALAHYTVIGEGTANASGHLDFIFENGADDNDNANTTIGTEVLSGGSLTKKFTVWNDLNDDGIIDIDTGETAERVFYTADGTASMEDSIANPGINYSILDPITGQAFVYFYGDIDHGPQNGRGRDDLDGFQVFSDTGSADDGGFIKGIVGNFAADLYEFHVNNLASESAETADWQPSQDRANDQNAGGLLATSASARALSFEQLGAFIAANFSNNAAGSNPDVLDYIRDDVGFNFNGNVENEDDISGLAGWPGSAPSGWMQNYYWVGTASPSGHAAVSFSNGSMFEVVDTISTDVAFYAASVL